MGVGRWILLACLFAACNQPQPQSEPASGTETVSGEDMFTQRCVQCHGVDGKAGLSGASDLSISTLSSEEIKEVVSEGRNSMPPFKAYFDSEKTLDATIDYVKSLRK